MVMANIISTQYAKNSIAYRWEMMMQKNADLYNLIQQVQGAIYQAGQKQYLTTLTDEERDNQPQRPPLLNVRGGYAESIGWMMVQLFEFDPEPLTVEKFRVRAVYSAPRLSQAFLELIASEKWANRVGEAYTLTDTGRDVIKQLINQRSTTFADFEPIPPDELSKLVMYSEQIFETALDNGDEKSTWCLRHSQRRKPDTSESSTAKLIHVGSDFNAWRDDAHMTAYKEQDVDGMVWETFSYVDDGKAHTAPHLFDQLAYRGWTVEEWQTALDCLVDRGWIGSDKTGYQSTDEGKSVHQTVEQKTDELFYAPWTVLSQNEQVEYVYLLNKLNDTCTTILSK